MGGQCFSINVPNTDVSIQGGSGAVEGISLTTGNKIFTNSGSSTFFESKSDMKLASTGLLGAAGTTGVVIGTPATIQATAGAAVQIYAGAGLTPDIGGPGGPGDAFGPSKPAEVNAGKKAEGLNRINDGLKAAGSLASAGLDVYDGASGIAGATSKMETAEGALNVAKGAFGALKGGWDMSKAVNGGDAGDAGESVESGMGYADDGLKVLEAGAKLAKGDVAGGATGLASVAAGRVAKQFEGGDPMSADELAEATAAQQAKMDAATEGGHMAGAVDGPRIHEVAPANIDRECGADMTAKVAGDKTSLVDGSIKYTSGASISMKAFSKVETSSLNFEAHANVGAKMVGLATAKVESLGVATLEGKAQFKVATMATGKIVASKLQIEGKATTKLDSPDITVGDGNLTINSITKITKKTTVDAVLVVKKGTHCEDQLEVKQGASIAKNLSVGKSVRIKNEVKAKNIKA